MEGRNVLRVPGRIVLEGRVRRLRRRMIAAGVQALAIFTAFVILHARRSR